MIKISHMGHVACFSSKASTHRAKQMKQKQTTQNVLLMKKRKTQMLYFIEEQSFTQNNAKTKVEMKDTNQTMDSNDSKITFDDESSLSFIGTQKQLSLQVLHATMINITATHNLIFFCHFSKLIRAIQIRSGSS